MFTRMTWLFHKVIVLQIIKATSYNLMRPSLDAFRLFGLISRACFVIFKNQTSIFAIICGILLLQIPLHTSRARRMLSLRYEGICNKKKCSSSLGWRHGMNGYAGSCRQPNRISPGEKQHLIFVTTNRFHY